jgi:uncharacterized protein (TIGR03435 family)
MKRSTLLVALLLTATLHAQTSLPSFEVASIKPNHAIDPRIRFGVQPGGRLDIVGVPVINLIEAAYQLRILSRIIGAPSWTATDRFDVHAKAPEGTVATPSMTGLPSPFHLMLRALLVERFRLKSHMEMREVPVLALTVASNDGRVGPRLTRSDLDCEHQVEGERTAIKKPNGPLPPCGVFWGQARMAAAGRSMTYLASMIETQLDRKVVDKTGLAGNFSFVVTWTPDQFRGSASVPLAKGETLDPNGPSLMTALREQLGLKLESTKGPVEVLVIDHVERPTED